MSDATKRWARRRVTIKPEHDLAVSLEAIYAMGDALGAEVERLEAENKHYREVGIPAAHKAGLIIARGAERDAYARKVAEAVKDCAAGEAEWKCGCEEKIDRIPLDAIIKGVKP